MDSLKQRLADAFAPHPFTLSQPRPDGGRVVTLVDPQGKPCCSGSSPRCS
ncbi:hypothetical protein P4117_21545 [Pseudomonas aeruginosa]|nr:hypothetical protein [Pseudomonas aeruginosa]MDF5808527.1 hypothetical protein [Pseudomonas aeruginosa]MDF5827102.1 hypothetical protein [Pseudomonas aeruginosa]MDF5865527.1 hypothetical protein [Pseudomonas aeruginosa]MDF5879276.1 hypothetical protein [Pseudomonas aeruginosa]